MEQVGAVKMEKAKRYQVLDSWRGVCACMVALFHFKTNSHTYDLPFFRNAYLFVDFFFVLSGFVIFANYEERLRKGFGVVRFLVMRFGRVYPLHFAVLMAFIGWDIVQLIFPQVASFAKYAPFSGPGETSGYIVSNLLLTHSLGLHDYLALNGPSWSISTEFYAYVLFALAIVIFRNRIHLFLIASVILSPVFLYIFSPGFMDTTYRYGYVRCIYGFSLGALIWLFMDRSRGLFGDPNIGKRFLAVAEVVVLFLVILYVSFAGTGPLSLAAPVVFALTIYIFSFEAGLISILMRTRFFLFLGLLSYSIYMNEILVGGKFFFGLAGVAEKKLSVYVFSSVGGVKRLGIDLWQGDLFNILYLAVLVLFSWFTYKLVEEPGRRFFRGRVIGK
ncbi:MAG: acyltransferase [Desulfurivibrionaceae bacterium]|jgi:peptidoglycan/LPS O-acetylase OafA/YrhL